MPNGRARRASSRVALSRARARKITDSEYDRRGEYAFLGREKVRGLVDQPGRFIAGETEWRSIRTKGKMTDITPRPKVGLDSFPVLSTCARFELPRNGRAPGGGNEEVRGSFSSDTDRQTPGSHKTSSPPSRPVLTQLERARASFLPRGDHEKGITSARCCSPANKISFHRIDAQRGAR